MCNYDSVRKYCIANTLEVHPDSLPTKSSLF